MALIDTITSGTRLYEDLNSSGRGSQFSYEGCHALVDFLNEWSDDVGDVEYDPIGLCCEFTEYANFGELRENYGTDYKTLDDVSEETLVISVDAERFIIASF